jgi:hypothetical protein
MAKTVEKFSEKKAPIVFGILGDTYVYVNEREVQEEFVEQNGDSEEPVVNTVTLYEYDERHFPLKNKTYVGALTAMKSQVIDELTDYDSGLYAKYGENAINDFSVNGVHLWLDKETRVGLKLRFESELAAGQTSTTLWNGTTAIPLNVETAIGMLQQIELYASKCYDKTAEHKKNILALTTLEDTMNYDYKEGYPEKLEYTI